MDGGKWSLDREPGSYQVQLINLIFEPARSGSENCTMAMEDAVGAYEANV